MKRRRSHQGLFRLVLGVLLTFFLLVSCGGSPAAPSETPRLSILSATNILRVGASVDMTLQVVFSDGRNTVVTPVWGTDHPDIVLVKPLSASRQGATMEDGKTGVVDHMLFARVTGLSPGEALVTADSRFGSCSFSIRVIP
jgi:hypothetical protein